MTIRIIRNGSVYVNGAFQKKNLVIADGRIVSISDSDNGASISFPSSPLFEKTKNIAQSVASEEILDATDCFIFPGFVDMHVHFREPGFSYKETIATGTRAAARGGYTVCCTMPNLNPVPDSLANLRVQLEIIEKTACIHVLPYGAITQGEKGAVLSDMEALAPYVVGFTDDGAGVANTEIMRQAMQRARQLKKPVAAHAEDLTLTRGGVIHDGDYAKRHGLPGNPSESEWRQVERDIQLARETGVQYHVCHVSTKESARLVADAQKEGLPVTCETAPHYLTLTDADLRDEGRFKMNPPIRSADDRTALQKGIIDGSIACIATDHAPHSKEEKSKGLLKSLNGIVGLETAFPILYTRLVRTGLLPLSVLIERMSTAPHRIFSLSHVHEVGHTFGIGEKIAEGKPCDLAIFDLNHPYRIDSADFLSKGKASPYLGEKVYGKCLLTLVGGEVAYEDPQFRLSKSLRK